MLKSNDLPGPEPGTTKPDLSLKSTNKSTIIP